MTTPVPMPPPRAQRSTGTSMDSLTTSQTTRRRTQKCSPRNGGQQWPTSMVRSVCVCGCTLPTSVCFESHWNVLHTGTNPWGVWSCPCVELASHTCCTGQTSGWMRSIALLLLVLFVTVGGRCNPMLLHLCMSPPAARVCSECFNLPCYHMPPTSTARQL